MTTAIQAEWIEKLKSVGDPAETLNQPKDWTDYISRFALTPKDIPALIDLALQWADPEMAFDDTEFAPIHAWRALGQLKSIDAVEALIGILNELDKADDDWHMVEFPQVFALVGPAAVPLLANFLADPNNLLYPRITVANALCKIAMTSPEAREQVILHLTGLLEKHLENNISLNGFLVSYLIELQARESAETIERAFAANQVEEEIVGHWAMVRKELGVPGLGIAPDGPMQKRPFSDFATSITALLDPPPHQSSRSAKRAMRKRKRQNRKRNRKRR